MRAVGLMSVSLESECPLEAFLTMASKRIGFEIRRQVSGGGVEQYGFTVC